MANIKISDLAPVTLPIDAANTFFELQTVEGGIQVSRKISASDLGVGGATLPVPTTAFSTLRVDAAGTAWEETNLLQTAATQVIVEGINLRIRTGGQFVINTDDNLASALSIDGPPAAAGQVTFTMTGTTVFNASDASSMINFQIGGASRVQIDGANSRTVFNDYPLFIEERAAAEPDVGGFGQLWVRNDTPNVLVFTDDVGTDTVLGAGGGGTPGGAVNSVQFNNAGAFGGFGDWDGSTLEIAESQARITLDETDGGGACSIFLTSTTTADSGLVIEFDSSTGTDARIRQATSAGTLQDIWISMAEDAGVGLRFNNIQKMVTVANGVQMDDSIYIVEKVAAGGDVAGQGQLWVRNDAPNNLVFTADDGTDYDLTPPGGVSDPLIIGSINVTSALAPTTGAGYVNCPINIGANLTGTMPMTVLARQRIQNHTSSFAFGGTLFINIEGGDVQIGGLNSASVLVDSNNSVELQHGVSSTVIMRTVADGIELPADGTLFIDERAAAASSVATDGQIWVRDDTPNKLMFTNDAGQDFAITPEFVEQTTDSTVNNTTTLAATQLQFADVPLGWYRIDAMFLLRDVAVSGSGARIDVSITGAGASSVARLANKNFSGAGAPSYDEIGLATDLFDAIGLVTGSGTSRMMFTGYIEFVSGTNTFEVEFAQNVATVGDLDFEAGSWCSLTKMGQ